MRGFAFVLAILTSVVTVDVSAAPTSAAQRQEESTFIGFSRNETLAAFAVTVHGGARPFQIIRVLSTSTDEVVHTFRDGATSNDPEWQKARPEAQWAAFRERADFTAIRLDVSKSVFRVAVDPGDKYSAKAVKEKITLTGKEGSGLHTTPVVRCWDGQSVWLSETRINGVPGRTLKAEIEAYHSATGMHLAVLTHYTSTEPTAERTTDIARVFALPDRPLAVKSIGSVNVAEVADKIGERLFKELHPELSDAYDKWGRE